jgi:hypothetical protein
MKAGDKLVVVKNKDISQSYIPWGSTCEYVATFDVWICVLYDGREMLINKYLLVRNEE